MVKLLTSKKKPEQNLVAHTPSHKCNYNVKEFQFPKANTLCLKSNKNIFYSIKVYIKIKFLI